MKKNYLLLFFLLWITKTTYPAAASKKPAEKIVFGIRVTVLRHIATTTQLLEKKDTAKKTTPPASKNPTERKSHFMFKLETTEIQKVLQTTGCIPKIVISNNDLWIQTVKESNYELLSLLIAQAEEYGYNFINIKNYLGKTLMHYAAQTGNKDIIAKLIECKFAINIVDHYGSTPLLEALTHKHFELAELLLSQYNADINYHDETQENSLPIIFKAIKMNREDIVEFLIKHKAKLNKIYLTKVQIEKFTKQIDKDKASAIAEIIKLILEML